jgi:Protein of unknown function (DUF3618)
MGQESGTGGTAVSGSGDPEQIRKEIEETRQELGDTVAALAEKTDVKKRARRKVSRTKASAASKTAELKAATAEKKDELLGKAREVSPKTARAAAVQATHKAQRNPVPLVVAGGLVAGYVVSRMRSRR